MRAAWQAAASGRCWWLLPQGCPVVPQEHGLAPRAAGADTDEKGGRLPVQRHMARPAALGINDVQGGRVRVEVVDLQPNELAVAAAALEGGAHEPAEGRRAGVEEPARLLLTEVAQARSIGALERLCPAPSVVARHLALAEGVVQRGLENGEDAVRGGAIGPECPRGIAIGPDPLRPVASGEERGAERTSPQLTLDVQTMPVRAPLAAGPARAPRWHQPLRDARHGHQSFAQRFAGGTRRMAPQTAPELGTPGMFEGAGPYITA